MENISLEFLLEAQPTEEAKEIQTTVVDAIYKDFFSFFKTEKKFWLDFILYSLKQNPELTHEKEKKLKFKAMQIWVGVNKKTIRQLFPLDVIYGGYEAIQYDKESCTAKIIRKEDADYVFETGSFE